MLSRRLGAGVTPSPCRGLPPTSAPLRKGRAVPALQGGGRLRSLRLKGGGPLRAAEVLVVSLNGTVAGPTLTAANAGGRDALPGAAANIGGCSSATRASSFPS